MGTEALRFLLMFFSGWVHQGELEVIAYLKEENRVLRGQLCGRRLQLTNDQRHRLRSTLPLALMRRSYSRWAKRRPSSGERPGRRAPVARRVDPGAGDGTERTSRPAGGVGVASTQVGPRDILASAERTRPETGQARLAVATGVACKERVRGVSGERRECPGALAGSRTEMRVQIRNVR